MQQALILALIVSANALRLGQVNEESDDPVSIEKFLESGNWMEEELDRGSFGGLKAEDRLPEDQNHGTWFNRINPQGTKASKLYIKGRGDGLGSRALSITASMALAARYGLEFGGVLNPARKAHGVDAAKELVQVYGSNNFLVEALPTGPAQKFGSVEEMELFFSSGQKIPAGQNVLLTQYCVHCNMDKWIEKNGTSPNAFYTDKFLKAFRDASTLTKTQVSSSGKPIVAIHIRHSDEQDKLANPAIMSARTTSDNYYLAIADKIKEVLPDAEFHVVSLGAKHKFEEFTKRGMILHLNGPIQEAWSYLAMADVAVTAKSAFSFFPALLNDKCVIYQKMWHKPLTQWIQLDVKSAKKLTGDELNECLKKSKQ